MKFLIGRAPVKTRPPPYMSRVTTLLKVKVMVYNN